MVTIYRAHGLRVVIFTDDHEPAHVHVFGDGQAKITLAGAGGAPELMWARNMSHGEVRRSLRVVRGNQDYLLRRWRELHD